MTETQRKDTPFSDTLLIELGTEELPPTSLKALSNAFGQSLQTQLKTLNAQFGQVKTFATPRRLAISIEGLHALTARQEQEVWGPPAKIAFDSNGNPTKAAQAFAKKNNVPVDSLHAKSDGKVEKLYLAKTIGGEAVVDHIETLVKNALSQLPIKKRMRWGSQRDEFVRPIQWLVILFGKDIVPATILGHSAQRNTRGHRFHHNDTIALQDANAYVEQLETTGHVIPDFDKRQAIIKDQVIKAGETLGGQAVIDDDLLEEVTALVEKPVALSGKFDEAFLSVPSEALISSMKEHQKYFHVVNKEHTLLPHFITVSNIESTEPEKIIDGNERVIRPRLSDAAFFFETDKKISLESRCDKLKTLVFQNKLGSVFDKTQRIAQLGAAIAQQLNVDVSDVQRAATLCKSDLVSLLVYEFPDLQGIAGHHYALNDNENPDVAHAMQQQYWPRFAGDKLPNSDVGAVIALADRIDTIVGIFSVGEIPTGSKDPFALRRASLAVLRILVEQERHLDLAQLVSLSLSFYSHDIAPETEKNALNYMLERFKSWYIDANVAIEVFNSVAAKNLTHPFDIDRRVKAVHHFSELPEATSLAAANKRVSNILAKQNSPVSQTINEALLQEDAEKSLFSALQAVSQDASEFAEKARYGESLKTLAVLRESVDAFFDNVMVMCEDEALRANRLALLKRLRELFLNVADISHLVPAK